MAVRKDVQAKTEQMEKSVRVAEREYSRKMAELNRGFEVCVPNTPELVPLLTIQVSLLVNRSLEWRAE